MTLDSNTDFLYHERGLGQALELLRKHLSADDVQPPQPAVSVAQLGSTLPEHGIGPDTALAALAPVVLDSARRLRDPGFLGHMYPPTPWVTWAASLWTDALNQNLLHPDTAPAARDLEALVVSWLAPLFGMRGGHPVTGSTVGNLTALWAARELRGVAEVVTSQASHLSVRKAANILGLTYREVPVDNQQRMRTDELGDLSRSALVLTAGTVAAGAVDALDAACGAAWRHVDAAWGGTAATVGQIRRSAGRCAVCRLGRRFRVTSGIVLFADVTAAHEALSFGSGYLAAPNVGVLGSHGATAAALAATLLAWGRTGTAARIERCMDIADTLAGLVATHDELELCVQPSTGVALWRPNQRGRTSSSRAIVRRLRVTRVHPRRDMAALGIGNPFAHPRFVVERVLAACHRAR